MSYPNDVTEHKSTSSSYSHDQFGHWSFFYWQLLSNWLHSGTRLWVGPVVNIIHKLRPKWSSHLYVFAVLFYFRIWMFSMAKQTSFSCMSLSCYRDQQKHCTSSPLYQDKNQIKHDVINGGLTYKQYSMTFKLPTSNVRLFFYGKPWAKPFFLKVAKAFEVVFNPYLHRTHSPSVRIDAIHLIIVMVSVNLFLRSVAIESKTSGHWGFRLRIRGSSFWGYGKRLCIICLIYNIWKYTGNSWPEWKKSGVNGEKSRLLNDNLAPLICNNRHVPTYSLEGSMCNQRGRCRCPLGVFEA